MNTLNLGKSTLSWSKHLNLGHWLLLINSLFGALTFTFVPLFFRKEGFPLYLLFLIPLIYSSFGVVLISLIKHYNLKWFLVGGLISLSLMPISLLAFNGLLALISYALFSGLTLILFWIPLNYLYFENSQRSKNATTSSTYYIISGLMSVLLPPLGALLIHWQSYPFLFIFAAAGFLLSSLFVFKSFFKFIPPTENNFSLPLITCLKEFKNLKTITFCEGALHFFNSQVITIYTLLYLNSELSFGWFSSYLAVIGLAIALILSYFSDHHQKRKIFINILFILMSLLIFTFSLADNLSLWLILVGIYFVISTISSPLRLAISMDTKTINLQFWKARELFLNLGRATTLTLALICFYFQLYWIVFIIYGLIALSYPLLVKNKLKSLN